jgi:hypothetical protein
MAVITNSANLAVGYNINTPNPIDGRTVVENKSDLIDDTKWNASTEFYVGLPVYVKNTNEFYILNNKTGVLVTLSSATDEQKATAYACWTKMATSGDLNSSVTDLSQTLAGVFQFQGVADSLDPDKTIITTSSTVIKQNETDETTTSYTCTGYRYNLLHEKYFKWENASASLTEFYTKEGETPVQLYDCTSTESGTALYVSYRGDLYFPATSSNITEFTSIEGDSIYTASAVSGAATGVTFYSSSTTQDESTEIGDLDIVSYSVYQFTVRSSQPYSVTAGSATEAAADNTGHVYQIGEKEYASNGLIWVELGSPKEEITWLVL